MRGFPIIWSIAVVLACACGSNAGPEATIAQVGDSYISVEEFSRNYQLGSPGRSGFPGGREAYLNALIKELLLAREGRRLGLDRRPSVQRRIRSLEEALLVGKVFDTDANQAVRVSGTVVDSLRRLDAVRFRLRFIPALNAELAARLRKIYREDGFEAAVETLADSEEGLEDLRPEDLVTEYASPRDLDPTVLASVRDLPVGQVSKPIAYRDSYLLLEVIDILRTAVSEIPTAQETARYREIAYQQQSQKAARALIQRTMTESELRLRGSIYRRLESALWTWLSCKNVQPTNGKLTYSLEDRLERDRGALADAIRALLDETIMTTREGSWTVGEFLAEYPVDRYPLSTRSLEAFRNDYYDAFGLLLRDRSFVEKAVAAGYDNDPGIRREVALWTNKWVYEEFVASVADSIRVTAKDVEAYFRRHRSFWAGDTLQIDVLEDVKKNIVRAKIVQRIEELVSGLAEKVPIRIDTVALLSLDLPESDHGAPSMQLFKASTGRPAYPVLDYGLYGGIDR